MRKVGWFRALKLYYQDPSRSTLGKLVVFFALIYVISPVDLIPDVPFIGWLDDLGVFGLATAWLTRTISHYRDVSSPDELRTRRPFSVSP